MSNNPFTLLGNNKGLNTVIESQEIPYNDNGVEFLSTAVNIVMTDVGKVKSRDGFKLKKVGSYHSYYKYLALQLVASGSSLLRLDLDYDTSTVTTVTAGQRIDYTGVNELVYFVNEREIGIVDQDGTFGFWEVGDYYGPVTNKTFSSPPIGHLVEYYNGRMYVAKDNYMFHSEPFNYGAFDYARGYTPFPSRLRLMRAISGGMFVGTEDVIYFLRGEGPKDFTQEIVSRDPALIGGYSRNKINGRYILDGKTIFGECIVIVTTKGICIGGHTSTGFFTSTAGVLTTITEDRVGIFDYLEASVLFDKDKILVTLQG